MKVDFFIVGVQKGGTTAPDTLLRAHPQIRMPFDVKEVHFFDRDDLDWANPDYDELHRHFRFHGDGAVYGEATPIYMYWPPALERLRDYNPHARLIMLLRHPAWRAFSQWRQACARGSETLSFEAAVRASLDLLTQAPARGAGDGAFRRRSYIDRGHYAAQIERARAIFPSSQLLVLRTDQLWSEPRATLTAVQKYLGVRLVVEESAPSYIAPKKTMSSRAMGPDIQAFLTAHFRANIQRTAQLTGLDLTDWLDPGYAEPMHSN